MQYLLAAPTFFAILLLAFLGYLVVHNQYKRVNLHFLLFIVVDSMWLASVYAINFTSYRSSALLGRAVFASSICLIVGAFSFINVLLHFYRRRVLKATIYAFSAVLFLLTLLTPLVIKGVTVDTRSALLLASPIHGPLYALFPLYLLLALLGVFTPLFAHSKSHRTSHGVTVEQLTFVRLGLFFFALLSVSTNLLLPALFANQWPSTFAPLGSIVLALSFFIAIGRYQLFDIRFVALRAAAYLTTLSIVTFVFIAPFVLIITRLLGQSITSAQFALVVLFSVSLLYVLQYLRRFFDRITASIFFRNYYELQDVLDDLSNTLVRSPDLKSLRETTAKVLHDALKPTFVRYMLVRDRGDGEFARKLDEYCDSHNVTILDADEVAIKSRNLGSMLHTRDIAIAVKLHTTHEDLGFIVVGYKRSGELYTSHDRRLLSIAADEIAISLQNMLRFEQIQVFNVTLQEEVDNATSKLRRTNKRLEELDNIKDDFISMASHQLRTPLTSVKGYLSMVLDGDAGKISRQQSMMLKQAFASSQRMVFLITDLLNVSRLKTGKFVIDAAPTDLSAIVDEEVGELAEAAQIKGVDLVYKKPKSFPRLMIDDVKIRQVIMNFIDNAIYYTPSGGNIKVELTDKPSTVELRVIDDGIGVPRDEQHHLFTKFYRATNARKARPDGTGLGLFMAQKVIAAQGGSVIFSSREHHGSTFGFTFSKHRLGLHEPAKLMASRANVSAEPRRPAAVH